MSRFPRIRLGSSWRAGVAALEFALCLPVLLLLLLAGVDLALLMQARFRLDQTAFGAGSVITQYKDLYESDLAQGNCAAPLFVAAQRIAASVPVSGAQGATIISGITNPSGVPVIAWQRRCGSLAAASAFGAEGAVPVLPDQFVVPRGTSIVAVEVATAMTAWALSSRFMGGPGASVLSSYSLQQPRTALLSTITAGTRP